MEQKIFYLSLNDPMGFIGDVLDHRNDQLDEKVKALNSQGWKVESVFCVESTSVVGFLCTKN
jgi:hypothetical protein